MGGEFMPYSKKGSVNMSKKKHTAKSLETGIQGYFDKISHTVQVYDYIPTDKTLASGRPALQAKEAVSDSGTPLMAVEYAQTPSIAGLCLHLGISKVTFRAYAGQADMADLIEDALLRIEDYWSAQCTGKGAVGAKFVLANNFGWTNWQEKQEIELGDKTRDTVSNLGPSEKMKILAEAARAMKEDKASHEA